MILVDDRGGAKARSSSSHYPTVLASLIPNSVLTRLDSADVAFSGHNGIMVGIELKKVTDAISCIFSGRLADTQLPAMAQVYDIRYLIVEELYRAEPATGVLQRWKAFPSDKDVRCGKWYDAHVGARRMMYQQFELWLHTLSEKGGARLEKTTDVEGTAALLRALYVWWQRADHSSYNVMQTVEGDAAALTRPTMMRRMLALLPGVGWERSGILAKRFTGVQFTPNGDAPESWLIERQIAMGTAQKIIQACNGAEHE